MFLSGFSESFVVVGGVGVHVFTWVLDSESFFLLIFRFCIKTRVCIACLGPWTYLTESGIA